MATKKNDQENQASEAESQAKAKNKGKSGMPAQDTGTRTSGKNASKSAKNPSPAKGKDNASKAPVKQPDKRKKDDDDMPVGESIKDIRQFLKEVVIEFQKITWPDKRQVMRESYSVLFLVTVITLMVLAFDWFLQQGIFGPLEHFARIHGGGVGRT